MRETRSKEIQRNAFLLNVKKLCAGNKKENTNCLSAISNIKLKWSSNEQRCKTY